MTRLFVLLGCLSLVACGDHQSASKQPDPAVDKRAKDVIVLSAEQQASAMIATRIATLSQEPETLRVKGRIALADDRIWKIGVRTVGSVVAVYADLGDFVHKGQILARYHADEVRDSRAQYRTALAELDRAKSAALQAQRNHDRAQRLLELKAGSVQQVEQTQQDLVTARGRREEGRDRSRSRTRPAGRRSQSPRRSAAERPG